MWKRERRKSLSQTQPDDENEQQKQDVNVVDQDARWFSELFF